MENIPTSSAPAPTVSVVKSDNSTMMGVVGFVLGLVLGGGIVWLVAPGGAAGPSMSPTPSASISGTPSAQATTDPYPGWKTYADTSKGYQLRYPTALESLPSDNGTLIDTPERVAMFKQLFAGGGGYPQPLFTSHAAASSEAARTSCPSGEEGPQTRIPLTIGGVATFGCVGSNMESVEVITVYIVRGGYQYYFSGIYQGVEKGMVDQMLASVTFTQ